MQGPNCDSDHFLVRVKYKQKIIIIQDNYEKRKKWNQEKVDDASFSKEYGKGIIRKMVQKVVKHQIEEEWHNIKVL